MVRDTDDPETTRVALRIRSCDNENCNQKAVTTDAPPVNCPSCHAGQLRYATGDVQTVEFEKAAIDRIPDSEIVERGDS